MQAFRWRIRPNANENVPVSVAIQTELSPPCECLNLNSGTQLAH